MNQLIHPARTQHAPTIGSFESELVTSESRRYFFDFFTIEPFWTVCKSDLTVFNYTKKAKNQNPAGGTMEEPDLN
jgi:hypothetical protein